MRRISTVIIIISLLAAASPSLAETVAPALTPSIVTAPTPVTANAVPTLPLAAKRFRVGYADIMKVAEQSDAGKVAKAHYEAKADRHKAQIETKQKMLEKQKAALEAKLPTYTPEQRTAKIKAYEKKVDELRQLLQAADKEMKPMQEELTREIYAKIEKASAAYGAANGFDAILEKRELLYLGGNVDAEDVTDALIKEVDKK